MRKLTFTLFVIISILHSSAICAETPNEIAIQIINSEPRIGYNPIDNSETELANAYAFNSRMKLNSMMANSPTVPEELRLSYAIFLIDQRLGITKVLRSGSSPLPKEEQLKKQRLILGKRLMELSQNKQN